MKRLWCFLALALILSLLCSACSAGVGHGGNEIMALVKENRKLLTRCAEEMKGFSLERCYVAMEKPKDKDGNVLSDEPVLMRYEKETDEREEIENETLESALNTLSLKLIFFQTASDSRQSVIFSFGKETETGLLQGFYYSFDSLPVGFWGRKGDLKKQENRYVQANRDGSAWYYTVAIEEGFFYFEKQGSLVA